MSLEVRLACNGVDWELVAATLKTVGMARFMGREAMARRGFTD